jgi:hypothetical protein
MHLSPKDISAELKKIEFHTPVKFSPMDNGTYQIQIASLDNFKHTALKINPNANEAELLNITSKMLYEFMYVASKLLEERHKDFQLEDNVKENSGKQAAQATANLTFDIVKLSQKDLGSLNSAVNLCRHTLSRFTDFISNERANELVQEGNYAVSINTKTQNFSISNTPYLRITQGNNTVGVLENSVTSPAAYIPKF